LEEHFHERARRLNLTNRALRDRRIGRQTKPGTYFCQQDLQRRWDVKRSDIGPVRRRHDVGGRR
jgi:hypothetical protein